MLDHLVEQKIAIQVAQRRKLASHRTAIHGIAEQLLDELAHVVALGIEQCALVLLEKAGELSDVGGVGRDGERRQTLFDLQIVEESVDYAGVGFRGHSTEYARYRTLREVIRHMPKSFNHRGHRGHGGQSVL